MSSYSNANNSSQLKLCLTSYMLNCRFLSRTSFDQSNACLYFSYKDWFGSHTTILFTSWGGSYIYHETPYPLFETHNGATVRIESEKKNNFLERTLTVRCSSICCRFDYFPGKMLYSEAIILERTQYLDTALVHKACEFLLH
jgi:hypothetical protein